MTTSSRRATRKSDDQAQFEDMRMALARAGSKSQIHVYPDAPHAFHADYRPSYRKDAAEDGWKNVGVVAEEWCLTL